MTSDHFAPEKRHSEACQWRRPNPQMEWTAEKRGCSAAGR